MGKRRAFCTVSGLKRNKKFALRKIKEAENCVEECSKKSQGVQKQEYNLECEGEGTSKANDVGKLSNSSSLPITKLLSARKLSDTSKLITKNSSGKKTVEIECDVFKRLIKEEMKINERRRILFCDRPVGMLLGLTKTSPFTSSEIRPLRFRHFRKSIRTHILLIYEWLRCWPVYEKFSNIDRITILRNCVLYHTILDPSYITVQIGYPERFVMHTGGYVSTSNDSEDGWEDEEEISSETKKRHFLNPPSRPGFINRLCI